MAQGMAAIDQLNLSIGDYPMQRGHPAGIHEEGSQIIVILDKMGGWREFSHTFENLCSINKKAKKTRKSGANPSVIWIIEF